MTMTVADVGADDGAMAPRADRPKRRSFTAEFKAAILAEYDAADREERVACRSIAAAELRIRTSGSAAVCTHLPRVASTSLTS
ncbi:hypothetical protein [Ornithinimicrobium sp. W1665]|uniref:hypothetical protein n=1 Tax=Ornithinimicrobium sp. W1665 TaxID=3416666 RepID=UPI003CEFAD37